MLRRFGFNPTVWSHFMGFEAVFGGLVFYFLHIHVDMKNDVVPVQIRGILPANVAAPCSWGMTIKFS